MRGLGGNLVKQKNKDSEDLGSSLALLLIVV